MRLIFSYCLFKSAFANCLYLVAEARLVTKLLGLQILFSFICLVFFWSFLLFFRLEGGITQHKFVGFISLFWEKCLECTSELQIFCFLNILFSLLIIWFMLFSGPRKTKLLVCMKFVCIFLKAFFMV